MIDLYDAGYWLREKIIQFSIWLIKKAEPCKNETLSRELHQLADKYARRPTGVWDD